MKPKHSFGGMSMPGEIAFVSKHAAEHKCIACYKSGKPLTLANVKSCDKEHPRCGGTLLAWFIIIQVSLINLGVMFYFRDLLLIGISYECLLCAEKSWGGFFFAPSWFLQQLTTKEPKDDKLKNALKGFKKLVKLEDAV